MVSIKFLEDDYFSNSYYAKIGGIKLSELNHIEASFLKLIDFDIFIKEKEFKDCFNYIFDLDQDQNRKETADEE